MIFYILKETAIVVVVIATTAIAVAVAAFMIKDVLV